MRFFSLKSVWSNFQLVIFKGALLCGGLFFGVVYHETLETYLLLIAIVGFALIAVVVVMFVAMGLAPPGTGHTPKLALTSELALTVETVVALVEEAKVASPLTRVQLRNA